MYILGIQKNYLSSVALFKDNVLIYYNEEERLNRIKKSSFFPFLCVDEIVKITKKIDKVLLTGYNRDGLDFIGGYLKKIGLIDNIENQTFSFYKDHHLIHSAKAFYNSDFNDALVFVVDGRGSSYNLSNGELAYETTSVYYFKKPNYFKCIFKKLFTNSIVSENVFLKPEVEQNLYYDIKPFSLDKDTQIEITNKHDLGHFYYYISDHMNFKGEEGKLMGLSAYGKYNNEINEIINMPDFFNYNLKQKNYGKTINCEKYNQFIGDKNLLDLSFAVQHKFEKDYLKLVETYTKKNMSKNIVLTGGTAYNVVNNYKIKKSLKDFELFVEPMCGDEGNSIGVCQFYLKQLNEETQFEKSKNLFIGGKYDYSINLKNTNIILQETSIEDIINLLINNNVVGLYQGKSEGGRRALGNRSLLLDPRLPEGKNIMNEIKKREYFRPFACSVLKEEVENWFNMCGIKESPFMTYAVQALKGVKEKINSVIHVDNTCRVQTITKEDNNILYTLIKEFYKKTNIPILMNTSFNLSGEPLVETPQDAIDTLQKSELKYLYFSDINKLASKI